MHRRIFNRDIIIAVLLAWIGSIYLEAGIGVLMASVFPLLIVVLWIEEIVEKRRRIIRLRKVLKKLINGNVLPPASKTGQIKITTP